MAADWPVAADWFWYVGSDHRHTHTYYVVAGTTPVLAHNCGGGGGSYKSPKDAGHHLSYELRAADGNVKVGGSLWSGNMTPEEASIKGGWNQ